MRHLVDAHSLIWALDDPSRLGLAALTALQDPANELLLSACTMWELSIKSGLTKLKLSLPFRQWMEKAIADLGLIVLPITLDHAERQAGLPFHHRDPRPPPGGAVARRGNPAGQHGCDVRSLWGHPGLVRKSSRTSPREREGCDASH